MSDLSDGVVSADGDERLNGMAANGDMGDPAAGIVNPRLSGVFGLVSGRTMWTSLSRTCASAAVRQLDGENVEHEGGLTITLRSDAVAEFLATLNKAPGSGEFGGFWPATESQELKLGGLTLNYGPTAFRAPHPRLVNRAELEEFAAQASTDAKRVSEPEPVEARFEPTDVAFRWVSRELALTYFETGHHPSKLDA